jgi:hypothetical protein
LAGKLEKEAIMISKSKVIFFPHEVIVRSPGLLPMLYRIPELAEELGIPEKAVGIYARSGLPVHVDPGGEQWINGRQFDEWLKQKKRPVKKRPLKQNEGFCFKCHRAVRIKAGRIHKRGRHLLLGGSCPKCKTRVFRGVGND